MRLIIGILLWCFFFLKLATPQTVGALSDNVARINDLTSISVHQYQTCHLSKTTEFLGYSYETGAPIYKNICEGLCISHIRQKHECRQQIDYVRVKLNPALYRPDYVKIVTQVVGCQCRPSRCVSFEYGYSEYTEHGQVTYDTCNRKCTCRYGQFDCCRQRKSYTSLSADERKRYHDTVKYVSTTPPYKAQYENIADMHKLNFLSGIHGGSLFFPQHRLHLLHYENLLQQIDCRVTIPYWDWHAQAGSPYIGIPWSDSDFWLGGSGNSSAGGCVTTGPFRNSVWLLPSGSCLRRNLNTIASLASYPDLQLLFNTFPNATASHYNGIRAGVESGPGMHNTVHCTIGGTMCSIDAATAPEFILHHARCDYDWALWQQLSPAHVTTYSGNATAPMIGTTYTPNDMFDLNNQLGVKVCYIKSGRFDWLVDIIADLNRDALRMIPRSPVTRTNSTWIFSQRLNLTQIQIEENMRNDPNITRLIQSVALTDELTPMTGFQFDLSNHMDELTVIGCLDDHNDLDITQRCDATEIENTQESVTSNGNNNGGGNGNKGNQTSRTP